jgi:glycosyltransferase involved in cell wall biosynthesis
MGSKILWHSNAPWVNTGYGVQTRIFAPRLADTLGHDVSISAYYGLAGATLRFKSCLILPCYAEVFGNDIIRAHAKFLESELIISLCDVWVTDPIKMARLPWAPWLPVDHDPAPPPVINVIRNGKASPIVFSRFGQRKLEEAGLDPVFYVPHGASEEFYTNIDKAQAKAKFGWEDKFVIGVVAANKGWPCRKSFPEIFDAYKRFLSRRSKAEREKIVLYLHTEQRSPWGVRLDQMMDHYGLPLESVFFVDQYRYVVGMETQYLVDAYNAMDVFLNPAMGEGFGIPILEAQACGVPVIVNNFSAMPELCFFGQKTGGEKFFTSQGSWQQIPKVKDIVAGIEWAYKLTATERASGAAYAKEKALEYHPDLITEKYWKPVLEQVLEIQSARTDLEYDDDYLLADMDDNKVAME